VTRATNLSRIISIIHDAAFLFSNKIKRSMHIYVVHCSVHFSPYLGVYLLCPFSPYLGVYLQPDWPCSVDLSKRTSVTRSENIYRADKI
jgi:hypothetical protein